MSADGTGQTRLTNHTASDEYPHWGPRGAKPVLHHVDLDATTVYLKRLGAHTFTATGKGVSNEALTWPKFAWNVQSGGGAIVDHGNNTATFTAAGTEGTFTNTVKAINVQCATATVIVDGTSPTVLSCTAGVTGKLETKFSEDVDKSQAETVANYTIRDLTTGETLNLTGKPFSYDSATHAATFTGLTLVVGHTVRVTVKNVSDHAGNPLGTPALASTTVVDDVPPTLIGCGASGNTIWAAFSEDVNTTEANTKADYNLQSPIGGPIDLTAVTLAYNAPTRTVTFSGLTLYQNDDFKVTVTGLHDLAGNGIANDGSTNVCSRVVGSVNSAPSVSDLVSPSDGAQAGRTPTFQVRGSDADGDRLKFKIEVLKDAVLLRTFDQTTTPADWDKSDYGSGETATFVVPADKALEGGAYTWRAYAYDGKQWSQPSASRSLNVASKMPSEITCAANPLSLIVNEKTTITGAVTPNPGSGVAVTITPIAPGQSSGVPVAVQTDSEGKFSATLTVTAPGTWTVKVSWAGNEQYVGAESQTSVFAGTGPGYAVIVAGGGMQTTNALWPSTETICDRAHSVLRRRGFKQSDVVYLSPRHPRDYDADGETDTDGPASVADLHNALNASAAYVGPERPLVLVLVDHGGTGTFEVNDREILYSSDLKTWLDDLQRSAASASKPFRVVLAMEACFSGTWLSRLANQQYERVLVTSAGDTPDTWTAVIGDGGYRSFSYQFWQQVLAGQSVNAAFNLARNGDPVQGISGAYWEGVQDPRLEDSGDGLGNTGSDGQRAARTWLGGNFAIAPIVPKITPVQSTMDIGSSTEATVEATVTDPLGFGLGKVWVVCEPPSYQPPLATGEFQTPAPAEPTYDMQPVPGGKWQAILTNLNESGAYKVKILAYDKQKNLALPVQIQITRLGISAVKLATFKTKIFADAASTCMLSASLTDAAGNTIAGATNRVTFTFESGADLATLVGQNPVAAQNGVAEIQLKAGAKPGEVKVKACAEGVANCSEATTITLAVLPTITGKLTNATGAGVTGATLSLQPGDKTVTTDRDGGFVFTDLQPGSYQVSVVDEDWFSVPGPKLVTVVDVDVTGQDFTLTDDATPKVAIVSPAEGAQQVVKKGQSFTVQWKYTELRPRGYQLSYQMKGSKKWTAFGPPVTTPMVAGKDVAMETTVTVSNSANTGVASLKVSMADTGYKKTRKGVQGVSEAINKDAIKITSGRGLQLLLRHVRVIGPGRLVVRLYLGESARVTVGVIAEGQGRPLVQRTFQLEEGENTVMLGVPWNEVSRRKAMRESLLLRVVVEAGERRAVLWATPRSVGRRLR